MYIYILLLGDGRDSVFKKERRREKEAMNSQMTAMQNLMRVSKYLDFSGKNFTSKLYSKL